ncbi:hypothetical protein Taro_021925, partial [Colocasia esculenta]|nr:hypothetical protein [Colocasia esculenta]
SKCADTQADCVDTTDYYFRTGFWDIQLLSTHRWTVSTPLVDTHVSVDDLLEFSEPLKSTLPKG